MRMIRTLFISFFLLFSFLNIIRAEESKDRLSNLLLQKVEYLLPYEPIDVVIPCAEKDREILDLCIEGIRKNGKNIRRIIVVSARQMTRKAEWFDEKNYPFSDRDLAEQIFGDEKLARNYLSKPSRIGWIKQQLYKLYAALVIPGISSNVLVLDADTIFLAPVEFLGRQGEGLYNPGKEHYKPYFIHAAKLIPGWRKIHASYSGISHHMLFQRSVIQDLFQIIESFHRVEAWKAICRCIDLNEVYGSSLSEYELYFNFVFARSSQMKIRPLKWKNVATLDLLSKYRRRGYSYISCHSYF